MSLFLREGGDDGYKNLRLFLKNIMRKRNKKQK